MIFNKTKALSGCGCLLVATLLLASCRGGGEAIEATPTPKPFCPQLFLAKPFAEKILLANKQHRLRVDSLTTRCKVKKEVLFLELKFVFSTRPILAKEKISVPMFVILTFDKKRLESRKNNRLLLQFNAKGIAEGRWNLLFSQLEIEGRPPQNLALFFGFLDGTTPAPPLHAQ